MLIAADLTVTLRKDPETEFDRGTFQTEPELRLLVVKKLVRMTSRAQHPGVHQPRIRRYLAQVRLVMLSGSTPTSKSENIGPSFPIPMRLLSQKLIVSIYSGLLQRGLFKALAYRPKHSGSL